MAFTRPLTRVTTFSIVTIIMINVSIVFIPSVVA